MLKPMHAVFYRLSFVWTKSCRMGNESSLQQNATRLGASSSKIVKMASSDDGVVEVMAEAVAVLPPRPDAIMTLLTTDDFLPGAQTLLYSVKVRSQPGRAIYISRHSRRRYSLFRNYFRRIFPILQNWLFLLPRMYHRRLGMPCILLFALEYWKWIRLISQRHRSSLFLAMSIHGKYRED